MLEAILNEVISVLRGTFFGGDLISLLIAFGSVLMAAFSMRRGGQIGSMTLLALALFAFGGYLRGLLASASAAGGGVTAGRLASQFEASLGVFMGLTAANLLAYFIAFMVMILAAFGARSVFRRG